MDNRYYAVIRSGQNPDDELHHWKYIKRIKKNGKWKYFYDDSELKKFENEVTEVRRNRTGGQNTTEYRKSDNFFSNTKTFRNDISIGGSKPIKSTKVTKYQGKIDRYYAKGEKIVYDTLLGKRSIGDRTRRNLTRARNRGKNYIRKLFNKK